MGNCILCCKNKPNGYFEYFDKNNEYNSPDSTFKISFGTIPSIVPPSSFSSIKIY